MRVVNLIYQLAPFVCVSSLIYLYTNDVDSMLNGVFDFMGVD